MDIQLGYWRWRLFRWNDHPNPYRNRPDDALNWLRQYQSDAVAMAEFTDLLRNSVTGGYAPSDPHLVMQQLAEKMSTGEILVCVDLCGPTTVVAYEEADDSAKDIAALVQTASPAAASQAVPPVLDDLEIESEPTLSGNTDSVAMAQALKDAAESGAPFCEECAKAAARQAAPPPAQEAEVEIDPATAMVLKNAAVDGVPFCEECAKAAAAQAAAQAPDPELVAQ
jgi:hypothetical protein